MGIVTTAGDDARAAELLYGISTAALAERESPLSVEGRWVARQGGELAGARIAFVRADDRTFVVPRVADEAAFAPLLAAAADRLEGRSYVTIDRERRTRIDAALDLGFRPDIESASFGVPFDAALSTLGRLRRSTRCEIVTADEVDPDALFELDVRLRQDIPGNDGWRGERHWFDDELSSPAFEPSAYAVAREPGNGELQGLCRCWRNPDGPALGMVGVVRPWRHGLLATTLLDRSLRAAGRWGWPTFATHTARSGLQRRLRRLGAVETGGYLRLRRP